MGKKEHEGDDYYVFDELKDLHLWVKILIAGGCPLGESLADCPLNDIMRLSVEARTQCIDDMHDAEVTQILNHHQACIAKRISENNFWR
ncbi:MAG: hypothetical protein ACOY4H_07540 [Thermodesulfobacteriota bacterium]